MLLTDEQKTKAVQYWSKFLKDPTAYMFNNGDDSTDGARTAMCAKLSRIHDFTQLDIEKFERTLNDYLSRDVDEYKLKLDVDYRPTKLLDNVAELSLGKKYQPMNTFPCKTNMHFTTDGKVILSEGYAAPDVVL